MQKALNFKWLFSDILFSSPLQTHVQDFLHMRLWGRRSALPFSGRAHFPLCAQSGLCLSPFVPDFPEVVRNYLDFSGQICDMIMV